MTLGELLLKYPDSGREGPRPRRATARYASAILWLLQFSTDSSRNPHDRACATEILAAYETRVSLSQASQVWLSELTKHRSRTFKTHPWGPGHRASMLDLAGLLIGVDPTGEMP